MAKINLSTQEINDMANSLQHWISELRELNNSIDNEVRYMSAEWKDPQYELFRTVIETTYKQIEMYIQQFQEMQQSLKRYAEMQDALRREFSQHMNKYH